MDKPKIAGWDVVLTTEEGQEIILKGVPDYVAVAVTDAIIEAGYPVRWVSWGGE